MPGFFEGIRTSARAFFERAADPAVQYEVVRGAGAGMAVTVSIKYQGKVENPDLCLMLTFCLAVALCLKGIHDRDNKWTYNTIGMMVAAMAQYAVIHGIEYVADSLSPTAPRIR